MLPFGERRHEVTTCPFGGEERSGVLGAEPMRRCARLASSARKDARSGVGGARRTSGDVPMLSCGLPESFSRVTARRAIGAEEEQWIVCLLLVQRVQESASCLVMTQVVSRRQLAWK